MRKRILSVLMIPLLLLAGCGQREAKLEKCFAAFREALNAAALVTATAALTADYGGTTQTYTLAVSYDGTTAEVEILEPALLAGVRASVRWGEASVEYDGVRLGAGPLDEEGTTPVSALPAILAAMSGGYVELLWRDGDHAAARIYTGESASCTVWIDSQTLVPAAAEITSGGRRVISCTFDEWALG